MSTHAQIVRLIEIISYYRLRNPETTKELPENLNELTVQEIYEFFLRPEHLVVNFYEPVYKVKYTTITVIVLVGLSFVSVTHSFGDCNIFFSDKTHPVKEIKETKIKYTYLPMTEEDYI